MSKTKTKNKKSVKKRTATATASLEWVPKTTKKLVQLDPNSLDKKAPSAVTEALMLRSESKAHTLITNTFKKFKGNAHEQTREDIRAYYKNKAYKEIPYKSVYQLYRDYCNRSKQKNIKLQSSKTWSPPPEHPKGICAFHPSNDQKIGEKDIEKHEKLAFRLLSKVLKNFPANDSEHNRKQRDKIKAHYRQCAYKNCPQLDITTLYEMAVANNQKKLREKRIHPPKKNLQTWSPPKNSGLVPVTTTPQKKKLSNERIASLKKKAYNLVRNSLIKFPIKSKELSAMNKKNNEKMREAIHAYYDTHAFSDLRHVSLGTLAKQHKNQFNIKQEVAHKDARPAADSNARDQGAEQLENFDKTTTQLMNDFYADDGEGLLNIDFQNDEAQSPNNTPGMEAFLKPITPAKTQPKEVPIETQKKRKGKSNDEELDPQANKRRRRRKRNIKI